MGITEKLRSPTVDPVAGCAFIITRLADHIWYIAETIIWNSRVSSDLSDRYRRYETPLWALIASDLLSFALAAIIGLGLARGRAWALWVQGLISFRLAFVYVTRPPGIPLSAHAAVSFCFSILVFVYSGLRIMGVLGDGPRPLFRKAVPTG